MITWHLNGEHGYKPRSNLLTPKTLLALGGYTTLSSLQNKYSKMISHSIFINVYMKCTKHCAGHWKLTIT